MPCTQKNFAYPGTYAACGFQIQLIRMQMQYLIQVYLPSCMFVVVSWVSFLIKPEVVPGRMALLVTLFLVLINIFNSVRERAPISSRLNAVDLYLVICIFLVFGALMEYAAILLLLKKRRKPKYTIDSGLKNMFSSTNGSNAPTTATAAIVATNVDGTTVTQRRVVSAFRAFNFNASFLSFVPRASLRLRSWSCSSQSSRRTG